MFHRGFPCWSLARHCGASLIIQVLFYHCDPLALSNCEVPFVPAHCPAHCFTWCCLIPFRASHILDVFLSLQELLVGAFRLIQVFAHCYFERFIHDSGYCKFLLLCCDLHYSKYTSIRVVPKMHIYYSTGNCGLCISMSWCSCVC